MLRDGSSDVYPTWAETESDTTTPSRAAAEPVGHGNEAAERGLEAELGCDPQTELDGELETSLDHDPDDGLAIDPDEDLNWREVHEELVSIAKRRAALDAREARWLRRAMRLQVWREVGQPSMREYLEETLGYAPNTANERMRVAEALGIMPDVEAALAAGDLSHSAVREITRVARRATQRAWADHCRGMKLKDVEQLVRRHKPGDNPTDPENPQPEEHVVRLVLGGEAYARWLQARRVLEDETNLRMDDNQLADAYTCRVLDGCTCQGGDQGRARYQIAVTMCAKCRFAVQDGGGEEVAIDEAALARATCDAQHIGSLDAETPERATQDIPPAVRRFVWRRDHGSCRIPGCRSKRNLEVHHILHREDGGTHEPSGLLVLCGGHHDAHHRGKITISGTAPDAVTVTYLYKQESHTASERETAPQGRSRGDGQAGAPHLQRSRAESKREPAHKPFAAVDDPLIKEAVSALTTAGFKAGLARQAVVTAWDELRGEVDLPDLIRAALQRCRGA